MRLAGAIVLETMAFSVWNLAARSPLGLLQDARQALALPRRLIAGAVAALVGAIFIGAAILLAAPVLPERERTFPAVELGSFIVALALAFLIGDDVRALARSHRRD